MINDKSTWLFYFSSLILSLPLFVYLASEWIAFYIIGLVVLLLGVGGIAPGLRGKVKTIYFGILSSAILAIVGSVLIRYLSA